MPLLNTSGNVTADAYAGGVALKPNYIEDVFSTYLYTGTGANQIITNGINLSTNGGLVWIKPRSSVNPHVLFDTNRGVQKFLQSNTTDAEGTASTSLTAFFTDGFRVGTDSIVNEAGTTYASWTFRKQPKFFDVVTWTGTGGTGDRAISHNLAAVPAAFTIKPLSFADNWQFRHKDLPADTVVFLNLINAATSAGNRYSSTPNTATTFYVNAAGAYNISGATYVAYLFAHNAGGFGLTGTDNVISCGSYTGNGSTTGPVVTLGYEPQWLMVKRTDDVDDWNIADNMRGLFVGDTSTTANSPRLRPNLSNAEQGSGWVIPTATGFQLQGPNAAAASYNASGGKYIYIAIRRGPMKVPTTGTSVFLPSVQAESGGAVVSTSFPVDMFFDSSRASNAYNMTWFDRLRGNGAGFLRSPSTAAETSLGTTPFGTVQNGVVPSMFSTSPVQWLFGRAPSFFDEVCYTGDGTSNSSVNHNLGVVPELFFVKRRNAGGSGDVNWGVYSKDRPSIAFNLILNSDTGWYNAGTNGWFGTGTLSSTLFPSGNASANFGNLSGGTYVAYLFATCAGVSKVGSFTGNGTSQTIPCGFTSGARFVLIKKSSGTGDWMVSDSARGIVAGSDPYLELNNTNAEVAGEDWLDTDSTGFVVNEVSGSNANTSGATYIFLAIA